MKILKSFYFSTQTQFIFQESRDYSLPQKPDLKGNTKQEAKQELYAYKAEQQENITELRGLLDDVNKEMSRMAHENIAKVKEIETAQMELSDTFMDLTLQLLDPEKLDGVFDRYMLPKAYNKKFLKNIFKEDSTTRFGIVDFETYNEPSEYYSFIKSADLVERVIAENQTDFFMPMEDTQLFESGKTKLLQVAQQINNLTKQRNDVAALPYAYHKDMHQDYYYGSEDSERRDTYNELMDLKRHYTAEYATEKSEYNEYATGIKKQARQAGRETKATQKVEQAMNKELNKGKINAGEKSIKRREKKLKGLLNKNE